MEEARQNEQKSNTDPSFGALMPQRMKGECCPLSDYFEYVHVGCLDEAEWYGVRIDSREREREKRETEPLLHRFWALTRR